MTDEFQPVHKIGLTSRVVQAVGYDEYRDALAMDWSNFLKLAIPEISWIQLPNIGKEIIDYAGEWDLDGFVLTGGNDLGELSLKDETDFAILAHSIEENLPLFGVCRGLQVIHSHFGGELQPCSPELHVANRHSIEFNDLFQVAELRNTNRVVNSFHNYGIRPEKLDPNIEPTAFSEDGFVEAAYVKNTRVSAVMWHPERNVPIDHTDIKIFRSALGLNTKKVAK
jgi:N5-(cytidine 5'-diphosphoramidyl)-L-glutamine hydrolase